MFKKLLSLSLVLFLINCGGGGGGGTDDDSGGGTGPSNDAPVAIFTGSPTSGPAPLTVTFASSSTNTTAHQWDFENDGSLDASGQVVGFTYQNAGTYSVSLTATGPGGSNVNTKTDYITVEPTAPTANFSTASEDEVAGIVPHMVKFNNLSTLYYSSLWDFGDGNTSTEENPSHTYESSGNFDVSLTVTGDGGSTSEVKTAFITVDNLQTPAFVLDPKYTTTSAGTDVSIDIKVIGVTGLSAAQATLSYGGLTYVSTTAGDFLEGNNVPLLTTSHSPGINRLVVYTASLSSDKPSADGDGVIATVTFTVDSNSTLGWGEDNPGAGAGGAGNYMLDLNGQAITFNGKDNAYIFVE